MRPAEKTGKGGPRFNFAIRIIFWLLAVFFIELIITFTVPVFTRSMNFLFIAIPGMTFFLLAVSLIILVAKSGFGGLLKKFLLITGAAPVGAVAGVVLHNLVSGIFIYFFGPDFWERTGIGDEPVFFIIAVIVCPIAFLAGTIGSIVMFARKKT